MSENIEFAFTDNIKFAAEPIEMFCRVVFDKYGKDNKYKLAVRLRDISKRENSYIANAYYDGATSACYDVKSQQSDGLLSANQRFSESGSEFTIFYGEKVIGKGKVL